MIVIYTGAMKVTIYTEVEIVQELNKRYFANGK